MGEGITRIEGHLERIAGHLALMAWAAKEQELRESAREDERLRRSAASVGSGEAVAMAVDPIPAAGSSFLIEL